MEIQPVARFESPLTTKFGVPRQSGLAASLPGRIVFEPAYRRDEAVRGLEAFDYLWLLWEFSAVRSPHSTPNSQPSTLNSHPSTLNPQPPTLTVRPPRLGGNQRMGVFATRSPFRPNRLGLSCVAIDHIEHHATLGPVIHVRGADLMDGTPIYDIKPYVAYADAHPDARSGFVDTAAWQPLEVELGSKAAAVFSPQEQEALRQILACDPRPRYHDDPMRIYGLPYAGRDVKFRVEGGRCIVIDVVIPSNTSQNL